MGSIARVRVFYTDLREWFKQQNQVPIYATMLDGEDVRKMSPLREGLIMIGNESRGIDKELLQFVNGRITIPKKVLPRRSAGEGEAESLNAAVAAGIVLACLA
jgi:TrmH family RNA methyltransferase